MAKKKLNNVEVFRYTIYGDPPSKKNSQVRTRTGYQIPNKKYRNWAKETKKQFKQDCVQKLQLNEPMNAKLLIYRQNRRGGPGDLNNFSHAPLDILTEWGVIKDDNRNIIYSLDGSRLFYDKENPRIEIVLTKIEEGS